MGRMLRTTLAEDQVYGIDLGFPRSGKLLIRNAGSNDVRVAYDRADANSTTGVNYFTVEAGITLVFDMSQAIGFLAQNQQLYFNSPDGANTMEFWMGYDS
tara:strand:- start:161 stop:460 length:300 start_codon:yes stop_codon:yes gene_type:complete